MRAILEAQRARIHKTAKEREHQLQQPNLPDLFGKDEIRQLEADKKHWHRRLDALERELDSEPARIRQSYVIKARRFEPVGLVYLWPVTG